MLERLLILFTFSIALCSVIGDFSHSKLPSALALKIIPLSNVQQILQGSAPNSTAPNSTAPNRISARANPSPEELNNTINKVKIPSESYVTPSVAIPFTQRELTTNPTKASTTLAPAHVAASLIAGSITDQNKNTISEHPHVNENNLFQQLPPVADAGPAQVVAAGSTVVPNGSNSKAENGKIIFFSWEQLPTNAKTTLSGVKTPVWEFIAPPVVADTILRFQLTVTDSSRQIGHGVVNILDKPNVEDNPEKDLGKKTVFTNPYSSITTGEYVNSVLIPPNATSKAAAGSQTISTTISPPLTPPISSTGDR